MENFVTGSIALALNIAAFIYLRSWRPIVLYVQGVRLTRRIAAMRVAGLLVLLIAISHSTAHAQTLNFRGVYHADKVYKQNDVVTFNGLTYACITPSRKTPTADPTKWLMISNTGNELITGVIRDQDWETARAIAAANGITVPEYSKGEDALIYPNGVWDKCTSRWHEDDFECEARPYLIDAKTGQPTKLAKTGIFIWKNIGVILFLAVAIFLMYGVQLKHDHVLTAEEMDDPDHRIGGWKNYHGDDAFVTPSGMHTEYEPVPVRRG